MLLVRDELFSPGSRRRLGFDPASVAPPPPTVEVAPNRGLSDGDTVHVTGAGFSPNEYVVVTECRAGFTTFRQCAFPFSFFSPPIEADASGRFDVDFKVRATPGFFSDSFDCSTTPESCRVVAINQSDFLERALQPITFG